MKDFWRGIFRLLHIGHFGLMIWLLYDIATKINVNNNNWFINLKFLTVIFMASWMYFMAIKWVIKYANDKEKVNHPNHYNFSKFEVIDVLEEWFDTYPLLWNAGKYLSRWNRKGRTKKEHIENLKKAQWYITRQIGKLEGRI